VAAGGSSSRGAVTTPNGLEGTRAPSVGIMEKGFLGAFVVPLPGIKLAILCGGSGTSRGSCGPTGPRNIMGQARKSSKSGIEARPLRSALSKTASGSVSA